mmetsp:Transcript_24355/g.76101  ORF Transcript_24355/g.76101 Transcript_24355/m.76101 type:complete len:347 (+) Transcript_24355:135-1175(+)
MDDADDVRDADEYENASENERALREGFTRGRVVWFGARDDWWQDWVFYVENQHTLVSMWRGHAMHPFERFDRVCYFLCVVCFSLFLSAYVQNAHPPHNGLAEYGVWVCLASALLVLYDVILKFIATSPCLQPGGSLHGACWLCRACCIDAGKQGLYIVSLCSLGFLVAGVTLAATADVDPGMYFATFFLMRVGNYAAEFGPLAYAFYSRRERQRCFWLDGEKGGAYPFGFSVPDPMFVHETRFQESVDTWPGDVENPMRRPSASDVQRRQTDRAARRERQVELLQKARTQVRAEQESRRPGGLPLPASRDRTPPISRDRTPPPVAPDSLDGFGSRRADPLDGFGRR